MIARVIWAVLLTIIIQFLVFLAVFGILQAVSPGYLAETFIIEKFQDSPELIPVLKSLFYEIAEGVGGVAGILGILWIVLLAFGDFSAPGYARGKRWIWWLFLIIGVIVTPAIGYFVVTSATLVAENVPVEVGLGSAVLFLIAYWIGTIFATPYMFRSGVPFGGPIAGWLKFP